MSSDDFQCYVCGEYKNVMWGNTCNLCRDKEEKHREHMTAMSKSDRTKSLQSMCATLESELSRLKKEAEWKDGMLERAKRVIEMVETVDEPIEDWLADLERGPLK